jgi:hypothetical protein
MVDSTFDRRNKMNKKRKAGSSASLKDPAMYLDGNPVSLKKYFLYLSEDLLL